MAKAKPNKRARASGAAVPRGKKAAGRPPREAAERERLRAYERDFRRAGLPMFIEDFSAAEDVWTRAAPLLGLVFFSEIFGAIDLDWPWWQNLLAVLGGLAVLLLAFGLLNKAKGRPFSAIPQRIGRAELAAFVLVPGILPELFNSQHTSAIATATTNLLLLALIYAFGALGLHHMIGWILGRFAASSAPPWAWSPPRPRCWRSSRCSRSRPRSCGRSSPRWTATPTP